MIIVVVMTFVVSIWIINTQEKKENIPQDQGKQTDQVAEFVRHFGEQLKEVSLIAPDASEQIKKQYGPYVADDLLSGWEEDPESAPGRLTSSPWPEGLVVKSVTKATSTENTYKVTAHLILMTSKERASVDTSDNAGWQYVTLTVVTVAGSEKKITPEANRWEITKYQLHPFAPGFDDDVSSTGLLIVRSDTEDGFTAVATYEGENHWRWQLSGTLPNPCYGIKTEVFVAESYPEQVSLNVSITSPDAGQMCIQRIKRVREYGTYEASQGASFALTVNRSGHRMPKNLPIHR